MMRFPHPRTFLVVGAFIGCIWLISLSATVLRNEYNSSRTRPTTPVRAISRVIFTPRSLVDFAGRHPRIESQDELLELLKKDGLDGTWYATANVEQMSDGKLEDFTTVIRIGQMEHQFAWTRDNLLIFAGKPSTLAVYGSVKPRVVVIPDDLARREPSEVLADLIEREKAK